MSFSLTRLFSGIASEVFSDLVPLATAQALAAGLSPIAGSMPSVTSYGDYAVISFSPAQEERVSEWIITQLRRDPGPVRVDAGGIAMKVLVRQYWPWAAGMVALGFAAGYLGGRR